MTMPEPTANGPEHPPVDDPVFMAALDLLRRTGASSFQIRYQDDEQPTVWIAVGEWKTTDGMPTPDGADIRHEAAGALHARTALLRLLEQVLDGGKCMHCQRPSGMEADSIDTMPANELICWYQYDPELKTFRRGCEGNTS